VRPSRVYPGSSRLLPVFWNWEGTQTYKHLFQGRFTVPRAVNEKSSQVKRKHQASKPRQLITK